MQVTLYPRWLLCTPDTKIFAVPAGTVDFLRNLEMSEDELSKAIIGTIGDVDAYQLPGDWRPFALVTLPAS